MRAFVHLREIMATHKDLARKLEEPEKKYLPAYRISLRQAGDKQVAVVFEAIRQLMTPPKRRIGFRVEEPKVVYKAKKRKM
jgi:hypothetical protein